MKLFFLTIVILQFFLKNSQGGKHLLIETKGETKGKGVKGEDFANTFSVGKSDGRVQQNNFGGDRHKLNVGHVGSSGKVQQNNYAGDGHDGRINTADKGSEITQNNIGGTKIFNVKKLII